MKLFLLHAYHAGCLPGYKLKLNDKFRLILEDSDLGDREPIFMAQYSRYAVKPILIASLLGDKDSDLTGQTLSEIRVFCRIYE
jgi:hypothetical protein